MSFRLRYTLLGTGVVAAALLIFGWLVSALVANTQAADQDKALTARVREAAAQFGSEPAVGGTSAPILGGAEDLRKHTDIFVELLDASSSVVSSTGAIDGEPPTIPASLLAKATSTRATLATVDLPGGPQLRVAIESSNRGYAVAGQPTSIQAQNLKGIKGFLIVSAIPTLLAAFVATWLVTGRLSRRFNFLIRRLEESTTQLETALEAQRRFVADASHELRTPLTTIRGNAGLLAFGPEVGDEVRAAASRDIASESERMSRLVEQLLTLAKADAGQGLQLAPVALRPIIEEVVRQAQALHPDREFRLELADVTVNGDPDALTQLLWILVDNAVKFTGEGGNIAIGLHSDGATALLTVADAGIGVPPADLDRIFERFFRVDASRSGKGAGLGLAIARWIATQHGGAITAHNNPGSGSTFTVAIPAH
jgi:two-component system, OmpR family, sensor kinase